MLKEISPARFTLRKEYFGGLVHDVSTTKFSEGLSPRSLIYSVFKLFTPAHPLNPRTNAPKPNPLINLFFILFTSHKYS